MHAHSRLVTVVETNAFMAAAKGRMAPEEVDRLIDLLAREPESGVVLRETGGVRKLRFAVQGAGKSGGVRVVYYFCNELMPVFLLTVFAKNEKENLSKAERNALAAGAQRLRDSYGV